MRKSSGKNIGQKRRTSVTAVEEEAIHISTESDHEPTTRERTPVTAVQDFSGDIQKIRADRIIRTRFTRPILNFLVHTLALFVAMVFAMVMMIVVGFNGDGFPFYSGLFGTALGGFIPNPSIKSDEKTSNLAAANEPSSTLAMDSEE